MRQELLRDSGDGGIGHIVSIKDRYSRFVNLANDFPSLKSLGDALEGLSLSLSLGDSGA